jgi:transcriptional regulator with XRE-family HTH domain
MMDLDMALAKQELAQRMRAARVRSGKSQEDIAEAAGVSLRQYNRYETAHSAPREKQIPSLAAALGLLDELLREVRSNRDILTAAAARTHERLEVLEARVDTHQETLTEVQRDFLQALGAPVPPPAADAPGRAKGTRSTNTQG